MGRRGGRSVCYCRETEENYVILQFCHGVFKAVHFTDFSHQRQGRPTRDKYAKVHVDSVLLCIVFTVLSPHILPHLHSPTRTLWVTFFGGISMYVTTNSLWV